jgi:purine-nucleoside/S-methyl-5'-thioadenosine phosphorylase / adenosine deaminase
MTVRDERVEAADERPYRRNVDPIEAVLRSDLLGLVPGVRHGLTSRAPGLGQADGNVGYSPPRDQEDAWAMRQVWCEAIVVAPERLVTLGQVHGAEVLRVSAHDAGIGARPGSGRLGLADALITDEPGVGLMTLHADCLPILLVDPERPAIAAIHAGWRGTVADVAGATVQAMGAAFGTDPTALLAFVGPGIGGCCYEVGEEVANAWCGRHDGASNALSPDRDRWSFDLRTANLEQLRWAGLDPARIDVSTICTRCAGERWFSHRGQGPLTGRFGAIIALEG